MQIIFVDYVRMIFASFFKLLLFLVFFFSIFLLRSSLLLLSVKVVDFSLITFLCSAYDFWRNLSVCYLYLL